MSDFFTTKIFTDGQLGVNGHDLNAIIAQASPNPDLITNKTLANQPSANGSDQLLLCQGGTTLVRTPYSGFFLPAYVRPAAGIPQYISTINGDMSVWQSNTSFANVATGTLTADMYKPITTLATGKANITQLDLLGSLVGGANNYRPRFGMRVTVATSQASLGAGEYFAVTQRIERTQARKLFDQPSSNSVWVRSSVAGTFSFGLRNSDATQSYKADFSVGTPNVWQRLTMPNIITMPDSSGNWGTNESDFCYEIDITLACGSTFQSATQNSWISGNFLGSASQLNLFATGAATFDISLLQHESGTVCTPFWPDQSVTETELKCSRYVTKSYNRLSFAGSTTDSSGIIVVAATTIAAFGTMPFKVPLRITPSAGNVNIYSDNSGTVNKLFDRLATADVSINSVSVSDKAIALIGSAATFTVAAGHIYTGHYFIDCSL